MGNVKIRKRNVTLSASSIDAPVIQNFSDGRIPIIGITRQLRGNKVGFIDLLDKISKKFGSSQQPKTTDSSLFKWRIIRRLDSLSTTIVGISGQPGFNTSGRANNFNIVLKDMICTKGNTMKLVDDSSEILITSSGRNVPGGYEFSAQIAQTSTSTFNYQYLISGKSISVRGSAFEEGSSTATDLLRAMPKEVDLFHGTQIFRKRAKITGSAATMTFDLIGCDKYENEMVAGEYTGRLKPTGAEQMFYLPTIVTDIRTGRNESLILQHLREVEATLLKGRANFDIETGQIANETLEDGKPIVKTSGVLDQLFTSGLPIKCVYDHDGSPRQQYNKLDALGRDLRDQVKAGSEGIEIITCGGRLLKEALFDRAWEHYASQFTVTLPSYNLPNISNMYKIDFKWGSYTFVELDELTNSLDGESSLKINSNGSQEEQLSGYGFSFVKPFGGASMPLKVVSKGDAYRDRTLVGGYIPGITGNIFNTKFATKGIIGSTQKFMESGGGMPSFNHISSAEDADCYLTLSELCVVVENPIDMIVYKPKAGVAFA